MHLIRLGLLLVMPSLALAQEPPQTTGDQAAKAKVTSATKSSKQEPASPANDNLKLDEDREALAKAVQIAHRGTDTPKKITRFKDAVIKMRPMAKAEDSFEIQLTADFISPRWFRYRIKESGKQMQEGWDEDGPWSRIDGDKETRSLEGKDSEQERDSIKKRRRLARQILEFLDPAKVIRKLTDLKKLRHNIPIKQGRKTIKCIEIVGTLDRYPLYFAQGEGQKVRIHIWVDSKKHELVAVQANALNSKGKPVIEGEYVLLARSQFYNSVLLPTTLIFSTTKGRRQSPEVRVDITSIQLGGKFDKKDLRRPRD